MGGGLGCLFGHHLAPLDCCLLGVVQLPCPIRVPGRVLYAPTWGRSCIGSANKDDGDERPVRFLFHLGARHPISPTFRTFLLVFFLPVAQPIVYSNNTHLIFSGARMLVCR